MIHWLVGVHDYLNSHWIFSTIGVLGIGWLEYRQGYKHGYAQGTQDELTKGS